MDLFKLALEIFEERKYINYKKIIPLYLCSLACHVFNLANKTRPAPIYTSGGLIPDMRCNMFMVTIPGFGKTYTIEQFISSHTGLVDSTELKTGRIGEVTTAGMVGSIKTSPDGAVIHTQGALQRKAEHLLCSDEFSLVTTSGKQQHSKTLNAMLLNALDSGNVNKDQVGGGIGFVTYATVWGAVQPAVYELGTGMPRRFIFVVYMPDYADFMKFRDAVDEADNLHLDLKKLLLFRHEFDKKYKDIMEKIQHIEYDPGFKKWMRNFMLPHYEVALFKRILLGYWLMKLDVIPETLVLTLNDEVKQIIEQEMVWRLEVQKGVEKIKIWEVIKNLEEITYDSLVKMLLSFSLDFQFIEKELMMLTARKYIRLNDDGTIVYNLKYGNGKA